MLDIPEDKLPIRVVTNTMGFPVAAYEYIGNHCVPILLEDRTQLSAVALVRLPKPFHGFYTFYRCQLTGVKMLHWVAAAYLQRAAEEIPAESAKDLV